MNKSVSQSVSDKHSQTVTTIFELPSLHARVTSIKFTKRQWVSESVSESVTDKHNQWSDSGPIKTWYVSFLPDPSSPNHHFFLLSKLIIVYLIGQQTTWYLVKSTTCSPFLVHPWCLKALYPRIYINNNNSMQIWYQSRQSTLNKQKACELIMKSSASMCGTQALKRNTTVWLWQV